MTGGRVVILGPTGRNFAAGMSGGIAYVWDPNNQFAANCSLDMVDLDGIEAQEEALELRSMIERHVRYTGSTVGQRLLDGWEDHVHQFVKVMPVDYKRVLEERRAAVSAG